jgi:hypothetical protein
MVKVVKIQVWTSQCRASGARPGCVDSCPADSGELLNIFKHRSGTLLPMAPFMEHILSAKPYLYVLT